MVFSNFDISFPFPELFFHISLIFNYISIRPPVQAQPPPFSLHLCHAMDKKLHIYSFFPHKYREISSIPGGKTTEKIQALAEKRIAFSS
jgi:hypothetical protein